jgi:hypothetical protein
VYYIVLYLVRELRFKIEYKDHTEHINIYDNETIRMYLSFIVKNKFFVLYLLDQLQLKIYEKLSVLPNRQKFTNNWTGKHYTDQV